MRLLFITESIMFSRSAEHAAGRVNEQTTITTGATFTVTPLCGTSGSHAPPYGDELPGNGVTMSNLYYHPEDHGLTIVYDVDAADAYEFDQFVIWRDGAGRYFWASDSGCSCPSPFEDVSNRDELEQGEARYALKALADWITSEDWSFQSRRNAVGNLPDLD
jgi:hypothetical protein